MNGGRDQGVADAMNQSLPMATMFGGQSEGEEGGERDLWMVATSKRAQPDRLSENIGTWGE